MINTSVRPVRRSTFSSKDAAEASHGTRPRVSATNKAPRAGIFPQFQDEESSCGWRVSTAPWYDFSLQCSQCCCHDSRYTSTVAINGGEYPPIIGGRLVTKSG